MKKSCLNGLLIITAALLVTPAVRADLTEQVSIRLSGTSIKGESTKSSGAVSVVGLPSTSSLVTIRWSGDKMKTETSGQGITEITITDFGSHVCTAWVPATKVMYIMPSTSIGLTVGRIPLATVVDMGQTKIILGHKAHLFRFLLKNSWLTRKGYAWIASDIPAPSQSGGANPLSVDASWLSQNQSGAKTKRLTGTWLKADVVSLMLGSHMKDSLAYQVTAVSTDPIPTSVFAIPEGYTITDSTKPRASGGHDILPQPAHA